MARPVEIKDCDKVTIWMPGEVHRTIKEHADALEQDYQLHYRRAMYQYAASLPNSKLGEQYDKRKKSSGKD